MQVLDYKKWLHLSIETSWLAVGFLQIFIKHLYAWYMLLIFDIWLYLLLEMLQLCNYQIQLNHNVSAVSRTYCSLHMHCQVIRTYTVGHMQRAITLVVHILDQHNLLLVAYAWGQQNQQNLFYCSLQLQAISSVDRMHRQTSNKFCWP